jgi:hypothetical protein
VHDAESDDLLAWLLLRHVHQRIGNFGLPKVLVQLPRLDEQHPNFAAVLTVAGRVAATGAAADAAAAASGGRTAAVASQSEIFSADAIERGDAITGTWNGDGFQPRLVFEGKREGFIFGTGTASTRTPSVYAHGVLVSTSPIYGRHEGRRVLP